MDWVDVKIDKNTKRIDVDLRVDLQDDGAEGLECKEMPNPNNTGSTVKICPWEKIPQDKLISGIPPIKTRTISYKELEIFALKGIEKYWSRKDNYFISIFGEKYQIYTKCINTTNKSMNSLKLIYNTNKKWGRSGNPGVLGKIYYRLLQLFRLV